MDYLIPVAIAVFSAVAAILALEARRMVYGAISLALFFAGLSLFFFYLDLPYLAVFQLIVYVGAIAVLIMFTVMIVGEKETKEGRLSLLLLGVLGFITIVGSFVFAIEYFSSLPVAQTAPSFNFIDLSKAVVSQYGLLLIVLACLLTASAYGAITLARREEVQK
ncbi:MAG: NADH-quinone oxidoreductase subunit J [Nitrososphaerota archaeon]